MSSWDIVTSAFCCACPHNVPAGENLTVAENANDRLASYDSNLASTTGSKGEDSVYRLGKGDDYDTCELDLGTLRPSTISKIECTVVSTASRSSLRSSFRSVNSNGAAKPRAVSFPEAQAIEEVIEFEYDLEQAASMYDLSVRSGSDVSFPTDGSMFVDARELLSGFVWKLKSPITNEKDAQAKVLSNWYQRDYSLKKVEESGKIVLIYISEKHNDVPVLSAVLVAKNKAKAAKITTLPEIAIEMTDEQRTEACKKIYYYDRALYNKEARYRTVEAYVAEMPKKMWPVLIVWKDQEKHSHKLVLGMQSESERSTWMMRLKNACGLKS